MLNHDKLLLYLQANQSQPAMDNLLKFADVEHAIIDLRGQKVILDADVAKLYGVLTKEVNQAIRNNISKFPPGYIIELTKEEYDDLRSKFLTTNISSKSRYLPKAFTEKGLYMLATILKSEVAVLKLKHTVKRKK